MNVPQPQLQRIVTGLRPLTVRVVRRPRGHVYVISRRVMESPPFLESKGERSMMMLPPVGKSRLLLELLANVLADSVRVCASEANRTSASSARSCGLCMGLEQIAPHRQSDTRHEKRDADQPHR